MLHLILKKLKMKNIKNTGKVDFKKKIQLTLYLQKIK